MFKPMTKEEFIKFARFTVMEQTAADMMAPAERVRDDLRRFDPVAAELWMRSAEALKEMSDHFKSKMEAQAYDGLKEGDEEPSVTVFTRE